MSGMRPIKGLMEHRTDAAEPEDLVVGMRFRWHPHPKGVPRGVWLVEAFTDTRVKCRFEKADKSISKWTSVPPSKMPTRTVSLKEWLATARILREQPEYRTREEQESMEAMGERIWQEMQEARAAAEAAKTLEERQQEAAERAWKLAEKEAAWRDAQATLAEMELADAAWYASFIPLREVEWAHLYAAIRVAEAAQKAHYARMEESRKARAEAEAAALQGLSSKERLLRHRPWLNPPEPGESEEMMKLMQANGAAEAALRAVEWAAGWGRPGPNIEYAKDLERWHRRQYLTERDGALGPWKDADLVEEDIERAEYEHKQELKKLFGD